MNTERNTPLYVKAFAGVAGGIFEAISLQPLDLAKTRIQMDKLGKYNNMFDCISKVKKREGFLALYKGLTPLVTHLGIKYCFRFGSFDIYKKNTEKLIQNTIFASFIAGLGSGITESIFIVTPFDVVKTRLQMSHHSMTDPHEIARIKYKGPIHCALTVVKEEGPTALWKGLTPTMIRQGSNQSCNFMTFYALNKYIWGKEIRNGQKIESWKSFVNGVIAGSVGPVLNNPFDVAKTRLMAQGNEKEYRNTIDCITKVFHQEGPTALWKGITPRLSRTALGQGIAWMTVMKFVEYYEKNYEI
tara:strand:+ start:338 stop:1240 length:903 start_codon:yes stop_codon:yes gene_type:complete